MVLLLLSLLCTLLCSTHRQRHTKSMCVRDPHAWCAHMREGDVNEQHTTKKNVCCICKSSSAVFEQVANWFGITAHNLAECLSARVLEARAGVSHGLVIVVGIVVVDAFHYLLQASCLVRNGQNFPLVFIYWLAWVFCLIPQSLDVMSVLWPILNTNHNN